MKNFILANLRFQKTKYFVYLSYLVNEIIGTLVFPIMINSVFWMYILENNTSNYEPLEMIIYLIFSNTLYLLINVDCVDTIAQDIKMYKLGQCLLYPISYQTKIVADFFCKILIRLFTIYLPLCFVVTIFISMEMDFLLLLELVISISMSMVLNMLMSFCIGFCSFYFTEVWGINAIKNFICMAFSGSFFPIDILHADLQNLVYLTPFPYLTFIPTKLLVDDCFVFEWKYFFIPLCWIVVFLVISSCLWKRGLNKYETCGI